VEINLATLHVGDILEVESGSFIRYRSGHVLLFLNKFEF
jgi:hypothetical protein